jgi:hypothetical protein
LLRVVLIVATITTALIAVQYKTLKAKWEEEMQGFQAAFGEDDDAG